MSERDDVLLAMLRNQAGQGYSTELVSRLGELSDEALAELLQTLASMYVGTARYAHERRNFTVKTTYCFSMHDDNKTWQQPPMLMSVKCSKRLYKTEDVLS